MTASMVEPMAGVAVVRDHIRAFSDRDWASYRMALHPEVSYQEFGPGRMVFGPDEVVATVRAWTYPFPDLKGEILHLMTAGNTVVVEIRWEGTFASAVPSPLGRIEPTGKRGMLHAAEVYRLADGKIREIRHYFDLTEALRSAGAMPTV